MNKNQYGYIGSGMMYTRFLTSRIDKTTFGSEKFHEVLQVAIDSIENFDLSFLFNAYTEANSIKSFSGLKVKDVYTDSGGLQMALYNKEITPEIKDKIYHAQGQNSTIAMCFDDIPLKCEQVSKDKSTSQRTNTSNKTFITSELKQRAQNTGKNVNRQLRVFADNDYVTKVLLIAQGNEPQEFADFVHYQYDEIDDDLKHKIQGIAVADTCIGNGVLETIDMTYGFGLIDIPKEYRNHIHYLGVGSISRLMPVIEMKRSGYLLDDLYVTFDSTSHTSSYVMGKLIDEFGDTHKLGTSPSKKNMEFFEHLYDEYMLPFFGKENKDEYISYKIQNLRGSKHIHNEGLIADLAFMTYFLAPFQMIKMFMKNVNECNANFDSYYNYVRDKKLISVMKVLGEMKTKEDIERFRNEYSKYISSNRIKRENDGTSDLSNFF